MTFNEAAITINGTPLTPGQSAAVRVALTEFSLSVQKPELLRALGPLCLAYRQRMDEVLRMIDETVG